MGAEFPFYLSHTVDTLVPDCVTKADVWAHEMGFDMVPLALKIAAAEHPGEWVEAVASSAAPDEDPIFVCSPEPHIQRQAGDEDEVDDYEGRHDGKEDSFEEKKDTWKRHQDSWTWSSWDEGGEKDSLWWRQLWDDGMEEDTWWHSSTDEDWSWWSNADAWDAGHPEHCLTAPTVSNDWVAPPA
ncbi:unnamed protein product, partial [Symbiodinium sp. KB8]